MPAAAAAPPARCWGLPAALALLLAALGLNYLVLFARAPQLRAGAEVAAPPPSSPELSVDLDTALSSEDSKVLAPALWSVVPASVTRDCPTDSPSSVRIANLAFEKSSFRPDAWRIRIDVATSLLESIHCMDMLNPLVLVNNESIVPTHVIRYRGSNGTSSSNFTFYAEAPCTSEFRLWLIQSWKAWALSTPSIGISGQCLDPERSPNLLPQIVLTTPPCPVVELNLPLCTRPQDLFSIGRWRATSSFIDVSSASLKGIAQLVNPWAFLNYPSFSWDPFVCRFRAASSQAAVGDTLANQVIVFVGDSILQEMFMTITNMVEQDAWSVEKNLYGQYSELVRLRPGYRHRLFDGTFPSLNLTLRYLWAGHSSLGENGQGAAVVQYQKWLSCLKVALNGSTLVVANGALHDSVYYATAGRNFTYESDLRFLLQQLTDINLQRRVLWLSTPHSFRRKYACDSLGNPSTEFFNAFAKRIIDSIPSVTFLDFARMGIGAGQHGDGRHCVLNYALSNRQYGLSCLWRAVTLVEALRLAVRKGLPAG